MVKPDAKPNRFKKYQTPDEMLPNALDKDDEPGIQPQLVMKAINSDATKNRAKNRTNLTSTDRNKNVNSE
jgi:hypothetical protein